MNRCEKLALLVVDDQPEVLDIYAEVLERQLGHQVECVSMPGEALRHVRSRLFDMVITDAKITYKGAPLGGLNLAEDVSGILGLDSVILMSQFDVREEVKHFNPTFTFLPKPRDAANLLAWVKKDLMGKICSLVNRQYGFVAMPFSDPESNVWYREKFVPWMRDAGFHVKRMDEIATTRPINQELLERIKLAHFVVLFIPTRNPNVLFEAGFAYAHAKNMIVLVPTLADLPWDISTTHAIAIHDVDDHKVRDALQSFMHRLRGFASDR